MVEEYFNFLRLFYDYLGCTGATYKSDRQILLDWKFLCESLDYIII